MVRCLALQTLCCGFMCCYWLWLQPYSYANFGGVMIPQMPVNYAQNAYAYQVHAHKHTPPHKGSRSHCTYAPACEMRGSIWLKVHLALLTPQSNIPSRPPIVASLGLSVALCLTADASPLIHSTPHLPGRRTRGHGLSIRWLHWIGVRIEVIKKKD